MTRKDLYFFALLLLFCFIQCKKEKKVIVDEVLQENIVPKFDSIDWKAEFPKITISESETDKKKQLITEYFTNFWETNNLSGGLLVAQNGEIIFERYIGCGNYQKEEAMTCDTPLHIASISKVLTGLAILKLIDNDKLALETKIEDIFPGFPYKDVRIQDLLNHRSGLPNYFHFTDKDNYWDKSQVLSNQDLFVLLMNDQPEEDCPPNQHFSYCNTNYALLALIIEKITGMSYPEAMKYMVFNPLGMTHTFVLDYEKSIDNVSLSYYYNGKPWPWNYLDATYGDKNIYSTPRDLLKMDIAMYSNKFLSKELKEKAWRGYSYESKGVKNYGLGIRLMEWENGKILYHNGWWHGNNSTYARDQESRAVVIALGNKKNRTIYKTFKLIGLFETYPDSVETLFEEGGN